MEINRQLNMVVPVETTAGTIFVHHTPVGRAVFDKYYTVIGKVWSYLIGEGLNYISGPSLAFLALRDFAMDKGVWEGPSGVAFGLVAEMERLTNVLVPGEGGWKLVPFSDAVKSKLLDDDAVSEVRGQLAFFTCAWFASPRNGREGMIRTTADLWGSVITALDCSAYRSSLPISTPEQPADTVNATAIPS